MELLSPSEALITWFRPIDAATVDVSQWSTAPSAVPAVSVDQSSTNVLLVSFDDDIDVETSVLYHGDARANLSPQVVAI